MVMAAVSLVVAAAVSIVVVVSADLVVAAMVVTATHPSDVP